MKHNTKFDFDIIDCHFTRGNCQGAPHFDAEIDGGDVLVITGTGRRTVVFPDHNITLTQNAPGQFYRMKGSAVKHAVAYHGKTSQFIFRRTNAAHTARPTKALTMPTSEEVICALTSLQ